MARRERGFTLIEIMVVITIIAVLAGMVVAVAPVIIERARRMECQRNLQQIGQLLQTKVAERKIKGYPGAAFLLQVKDDISNDQLKVFLCPGEPDNFDDPRPEEGSDEFIQMYRTLELPEGVMDRHTSFMGPEKWEAPKAGDAKHETWLWGCDKCLQNNPHHDGIAVLFNSSSVGFWELDQLQGHDPDEGKVIVGPDSPDKRLKRMRFTPDR